MANLSGVPLSSMDMSNIQPHIKYNAAVHDRVRRCSPSTLVYARRECGLIATIPVAFDTVMATLNYSKGDE